MATTAGVQKKKEEAEFTTRINALLDTAVDILRTGKQFSAPEIDKLYRDGLKARGERPGRDLSIVVKLASAEKKESKITDKSVLASIDLGEMLERRDKNFDRTWLNQKG